jgi:hypothetical protein
VCSGMAGCGNNELDVQVMTQNFPGGLKTDINGDAHRLDCIAWKDTMNSQ